MRVLTWNLKNGRAQVPRHRSLRAEFAEMLAGWEWDAALLQEVPPWWPPELARAAGATERTVLTARNWGRPIRRWLGERDPDRWGSWMGGANAILVRRVGIEEHRRRRLRLWPDRRKAQGVRLEDGTWVVNLHAAQSKDDPDQRDLARALAAAESWAGGAPLVLGGDLNHDAPRLPGLAPAASNRTDHVYVRGFAAVGPAERLEHDGLSDHAPLAVALQREGAGPGERPEE